jgi:hypothetical protein
VVRARGLKDASAYGIYALLSLGLLVRLWRNPANRVLGDNRRDQWLFEWMLTHAARVFTHGDSPFFSHQLNAPLGVNLMANTSILLLALPLAFITLTAGAPVTFAVISTVALAGTAAAWYFVLRRLPGLTASRPAAFIGGLFCGYAPAMVSQLTGHPNIAGQYVIPFIVLAAARLAGPAPAWKRGVGLAIPIVLQCFLNEEILFLAALAIVVFFLVYLPPREYGATVRRALPAVGWAAGVSGVLLAYPIWWQFTGAQAYGPLPSNVLTYNSDLTSFTAFARRSVAAGGQGGDPALANLLNNASEENTYFGWPFVTLMVAAGVGLWRVRLARAAVVTAAIFGALSLGPHLRYNGRLTSIPGPWWLFNTLPVLESIVPTRFALAMTPLFGLLLAYLVDRFVVRRESPMNEFELNHRLVWAMALGVALLPLGPTPQPAVDRHPLPTFFTSGQWRTVLPAHATVVPVPNGWDEDLAAMRWSTAGNQDFDVAGGYFLVPDPDSAERQASFGPPITPTMKLFEQVGRDGIVPSVTSAQQAQARADLAYWQATTLILPDDHYHALELRRTVDALYGPGQHLGGVWLWDVRGQAAPAPRAR